MPLIPSFLLTTNLNHTLNGGGGEAMLLNVPECQNVRTEMFTDFIVIKQEIKKATLSLKN